ncbi:MAG: ABC transporter substrate-binding protein [Tenacibaculum sp.]|nr:ABC transporter substrate-binding protein [Tenacibaculum sp.]
MKQYISLLLAIAINFVFTSCKNDIKNNNTKNSSEKTKIENVKYVYDDGSVKLNITVKETPKRAAAFSQFMTEMLLSLGLEDRMVLGTTEGEMLPSLKDAYEKVPTKIVGHHYPITREAFLLLNPDFVSGWDGTVKPETTGSAEDLVKRNIYPYTVKSTNSGSTLEDVFEEFYMLGKIFDVEEKADSLVKSLKNKLEKAKVNFKDAPKGKRRRATVMGPTDNGVYVASSLVSDLMEKANGVNIFKDLENDWELVSYEAIVDKDPEIIFIYGSANGMTIKERVDYVKKHPVLKNVTAVKNNNIHTILMPDTAPGIRNVDLIIKMNSLFYR